MGCRIYTGESFVDTENGAVIFEDDVIVEVLDAPPRTIGDDWSVVDLQGHTLLPGLINLHDHLYGKQIRTSPRTFADASSKLRSKSLDYLAVCGVKNAQDQLFSGVTTIRDFGLPGSVGLTVRDAIADGVFAGPRVIPSGDPICITGGHGHTGFAIEADGPSSILRAVRLQVKRGAQCAKFMASGGIGRFPDESPDSLEMTAEEMHIGIDEAHRRGLLTAAHAFPAAAIVNAVEAGVDSIEHGALADQDARQAMLDSSVSYVPTVSGLVALSAHHRMAGNDAVASRLDREVLDPLRENVESCWRMGIPIGTGSDVAGEVVEELELLQEITGGHTDEILRCATRTAAAIAGVDGSTGTLRPGYAADLVAVEGDVAEAGLRVLRSPRLVVARGNRFPGRALPLGARMSAN